MPLPALVLDPGPYRDVPVAPVLPCPVRGCPGSDPGAAAGPVVLKADGGRIAHAGSPKDGPGQSPSLWQESAPVRPVSPSLHGDRGKACRMYKKARRSLLRWAFYRSLPPWRSRAGRPVPLFPEGSGRRREEPLSLPATLQAAAEREDGEGQGRRAPFSQPSSPFSFSCSRAALEAPMPGRRRRSSTLAARMASRLPKVSQSRRAVAGPMPGRRMSSPERAA